MSEENKNRNKDKGRQNNKIKYDNQIADVELAKDNETESEFLNLDNKKNKRKRD
ncbi:hypothetical protein [Virgibacillus sp. DJP39]|uniref:hypothetical protein n=1 Tax=Virgibacillus sp. DJP39 TaxID=3409790 RepID=UPI003BB5E333